MRKGSAVSAERDEINACPAPGAPSGAATKQTVDALLGRPDPTGQSTASAASTPADRFAELQRLTAAYMDEAWSPASAVRHPGSAPF